MKYVIIGSGVAGVTAARELAKADESAQVHLFNAETVPYYPRPRLWEFIAGKIEAENIFFQPEAWYAGQGITLHSSVSVTAIEPGQHRVRLSDGSRAGYDRLLLACGARPFTPPLPGNDLPGVFTLRTLVDARIIAAHADTIDETVIIGGGLLGLETANSLRLRGKKATVIEYAPHLLPRQLDPEGSLVLRGYLEGLGMQIRTAVETEAVRQEDGKLSVALKGGGRIVAGLVLLSTGIRPNLELAREAGIETDKGVLIDDHLQTGSRDIFAAGDVCEHDGTVYGIIPAAMEQARAAAKSMLSRQAEPYRGTLPSTRLKIAGMEFHSLGDSAAGRDEEGVTVLRYENAAGGIYRRLNVKDGSISGAILLGEQHNIQPIKMLINGKKDVSPRLEEMATADFDFKALALESSA